MTKIICDICGREMKLIPAYVNNAVSFRISYNGTVWDICDECRKDFDTWVKSKRGVTDADSN